MKYYYNGDILIRKSGNENLWVTTPGQIFIVVSFVKMDDYEDYKLVFRPIRNYFKDFFYKITHIRVTVK